MTKVEDYTLIFLQDGKNPIGSGFIVHEEGLVATCHHVLIDMLEEGENSPIGKHFVIANLERTVQMKALCIASDEPCDVALLQIDGSVPPGMEPARLINSEAISQKGYRFIIRAYGDLRERDIQHFDLSAGGIILGNSTQSVKDGIPVKMIQLHGKGILPGMSGAPVTVPQLNGVVGLVSARFNTKDEWMKGMVWVARIEDLVKLDKEERLQLLEPEVDSGFRNIIASGQASTIGTKSGPSVQGLSSEYWKRPQAYDPKHRWKLVVGRDEQLNEIFRRFSVTEEKRGNYLAVHGLPGMGKTSLASVYVNKYGTEEKYPGGVLWASLALEEMQQSSDSDRFRTIVEDKRKKGEFDVFLCHNTVDKPFVKEIGERLKENGILPWLDEWELPPGQDWMTELEKQIQKIKSAAVFVGKSGIALWQDKEQKLFIKQFVKRECPVIPVILPDCMKEPELSLFLEEMTFVDFRKKEPDPLKQLIWGITGEQTADSLFEDTKSVRTRQILIQWAREAYNEEYWQMFQANSQQVAFDAVAIRKLLDNHGPMLVVLDDAQSLDIIEQLIVALPSETDVLLTTRDGNLASKFMEKTDQEPMELLQLSEKDAVELLQSGQTDLQYEELLPLVTAVGAHPQTLRLIAPKIHQLSTIERRRDYIKDLLDNISSGAKTDSIQSFETAFTYLYNQISNEKLEKQAQYQQWLRYLGVLVPIEADFSTEMASVLWDTDENTAAAFLEQMEQDSLVDKTVDGRWSQHMLVRSSLRSKLLDQAGEWDSALQAYARYALQVAFKAQNFLTDSQWIIYDLPHVHYIGEMFARWLEEWLGINFFEMSLTNILQYQVDRKIIAQDIDKSQREVLEVYQAFFQHMAPYLIHNSLEKSLVQRWLTAGLITCTLLDIIDNQVIMLIFWSNWLTMYQRVEEAGQVLEHMNDIAERSSDTLNIRLWVASEKAGLLLVSEDMEGSLSELQQCLETFDKHEGIDPFVYSNLYQNLGLYYFLNSNWQIALDYFKKAIKLLNPDEESLQRLYITNLITRCYIELNNYEEALQFIADIEKYIDLPTICSLKPLLLNVKGFSYMKVGELESAEYELLKAITAAEEMSQIDILLAATNNFAYIKIIKGEFDDALIHLEKVSQLLQDAPDRNLESDVLGNFGTTYYYKGELEKALNYFKKSIQMLRDIKTPMVLLENLNITGKIFQSTRQLKEGLEFFGEVLDVVRERNLYSCEVVIVGWMAMLNFEDGNPQNAFQLFEDVLPKVDKITAPEERGYVLMMSANMHLSMGNMSEGINALTEAQGIWRRLSNKQLEAEASLILANIYYLTRDLERFHETFEQSEKLIISQSDVNQSLLSVYYQLRGLNRFEQQEYKDAIKDFEASAAINKATGDIENLIKNLSSIASCYFQMGENKSAYQMLESAMEQSKKTGQPQLQSLVQSNLGIMYLVKGDTERGKAFVQSAIDLLEQNGLNMDAAGQTSELLYYYQDIFPHFVIKSQKLNLSIEEALRILIRTSDMGLINFLLELPVFHSPDIISLINQQLSATQDTTLAEVLRIYRDVFERAKQENVLPSKTLDLNSFEHPEVYHWRGRVMLDCHAYSVALVQFNRAIEKNERVASFYVNRGWAHRGLGNYRTAKEDFNKAIELSTNTDESYLGRGVVCFERNDLEQALKDLDQAIKLNKNLAISYQWRGSLQLRMGDFTRALDDLNTAVELEPEKTDHLYWRGLAKLCSKNYPTAIDDLTKACDQDTPDSMNQAYAMLWLGLTNQQNKETTSSESYWQRGKNIAEKLINPFRSNLVKGLYYVMSCQFDMAYEAYEAVAKFRYVPHVLIGQINHLYFISEYILEKEQNIIKKIIKELEEEINLKISE
jgi:tetratricopeptide (TPR) repeat protein